MPDENPRLNAVTQALILESCHGIDGETINKWREKQEIIYTQYEQKAREFLAMLDAARENEREHPL